MTVLSVEQDVDRMTLTLTAEFDATPEQVWDLWEDPRKLERWWGPPHFPATFQTCELVAGGGATYYMTGPDGERYHGYWQITAANPPKLLEFDDGFAHADGSHQTDHPVTRSTVELFEQDGRTRMVLRSITSTPAQFAELVDMGMVEGLTAAVGQMDALLA